MPKAGLVLYIDAQLTQQRLNPWVQRFPWSVSGEKALFQQCYPQASLRALDRCGTTRWACTQYHNIKKIHRPCAKVHHRDEPVGPPDSYTT
jgi:hypothetical protein